MKSLLKSFHRIRLCLGVGNTLQNNPFLQNSYQWFAEEIKSLKWIQSVRCTLRFDIGNPCLSSHPFCLQRNNVKDRSESRKQQIQLFLQLLLRKLIIQVVYIESLNLLLFVLHWPRNSAWIERKMRKIGLPKYLLFSEFNECGPDLDKGKGFFIDMIW